jgi:hypothetical protein
MPVEYWITRRSLSSGAHSRDPLAGDDTESVARVVRVTDSIFKQLQRKRF